MTDREALARYISIANDRRREATGTPLPLSMYSLDALRNMLANTRNSAHARALSTELATR